MNQAAHASTFAGCEIPGLLRSVEGIHPAAVLAHAVAGLVVRGTDRKVCQLRISTLRVIGFRELDHLVEHSRIAYTQLAALNVAQPAEGFSILADREVFGMILEVL